MLTQQQFRLANEVLEASVVPPKTQELTPMESSAVDVPAAAAAGKVLAEASAAEAVEMAAVTAPESFDTESEGRMVGGYVVMAESGAAAVSVSLASGRLMKDLLQSLLP